MEQHAELSDFLLDRKLSVVKNHVPAVLTKHFAFHLLFLLHVLYLWEKKKNYVLVVVTMNVRINTTTVSAKPVG